MQWLEENFSEFFSIYFHDIATDAKSALQEFDATFDSQDDGRVVDFTVPPFEINDKTLNMDIAMNQEDYSKADALFVLDAGASGFEFTNLVYYVGNYISFSSRIAPSEGNRKSDDGKNITFSSRTAPGEANNANSDDGKNVSFSSRTAPGENDNDDDWGLKISFIVIVGYYLIFVIICFAWCACCPNCCRKENEDDKQTVSLSQVKPAAEDPVPAKPASPAKPVAATAEPAEPAAKAEKDGMTNGGGQTDIQYQRAAQVEEQSIMSNDKIGLLVKEERTELVQEERKQTSSMFPDIHGRSSMQQNVTTSFNAETPDIEAGKGSK